MKRLMLVAALLAGASVPAAAQFFGMPVWNSPKGGTGITISGDYGKPNADYGKGSAFGARGTVGLGSLSITAGLASYKPSGAPSSAMSLGGTAAFRVIGGSLLPVNVNLLAGGARTTADSVPDLTTIVAGGRRFALSPGPSPSMSARRRTWRNAADMTAVRSSHSPQSAAAASRIAKAAGVRL